MSNLAVKAMTIEEFVTWENNQEGKYEYLDGEIVAMTGGTIAHDCVRRNLDLVLSPHLRGTGCRIFGPDVALRAQSQRARVYPDLFVTCRAESIGDKEVSSAKWILEVLSPNTQGKDRVEKWAHYQQIEELQEYVLVDPQMHRVEVHRRAPDGHWQPPVVCKRDTPVRFESLDLETTFEVIFENVPEATDD
jgi:Uma2 family endonuclease